MTPTRTLTLGFRVLGSATERRRLVDHAAAFAAYAECDGKAEVNREAYLSAFTYGEDFRRYLHETGSTKGYDGPCWASYLWFDLDGDDLNAILAQARGLAAFLLDRYRNLDDDALQLFFSGSKGFHIGLPVTGGLDASVSFHRVARRFAEALASDARVTIDYSVYDRVRLFRAPNSKHPKTGLHKRRLTLDELLHLDAGRIRQVAVSPDPFGLPAVTVADPQAAADWQAALLAVERESEVKAQRRAAAADGVPRLNRATLDFIRDSADQRIPPPGEHGDRRGSVNASMDYLRQFADVGVAVIVVSAIGRSKDSNGRSSYAGEGLNLASFRESSELEFGADDAFILTADDDQGDRVTLRHLKSRHGECRDIALTFHRPHQRFTPATSDTAAKPDAGKMRSALAALWARTKPAAADAEGDGDA